MQFKLHSLGPNISGAHHYPPSEARNDGPIWGGAERFDDGAIRELRLMIEHGVEP
jgi:hypothetical protein